MVEGTDDLAEALEEVVSETAETSTATEEATPTDETVEVGTEERSKTIPYKRFSEVVGQRNDLAEQLEAISTEKSNVEGSVGKLTDLLESAKEDQNLVSDIRALINHEDPRVVQAVKTVDQILQGNELEAEEKGEVSPEQATERTNKLIQKTKTDLEDQLSDARADAIVTRADALADKWLANLPDDYTKEDRDVVARLWTDNVDWSVVNSDPSSLDSHLAEKFQDAINTFGQPRGSMLSQEEIDEVINETVETPMPGITPEEELGELIKDKNYSGFKTVKSASGKETLAPEMSDDAFAAELAEAMKIGNRS